MEREGALCFFVVTSILGEDLEEWRTRQSGVMRDIDWPLVRAYDFLLTI